MPRYFDLTDDLDFGANYGLQSVYYKSQATNISRVGVIRLGRTETIAWRNQANNADLELSVNSSNALLFDGVAVGGGGGMTNPMTASGDIIYGGTAGAATALAKSTNGYFLTLSAGLPAWAALADATVTGKLLTGYVSGAGTVAATDSILAAIQKINGNVVLKVTGAASVTDGHLAVFDSNGYTIKDGGAVPAGGGDAISSATSVDNTIARYDGANNKTIQSSLLTIDDTTGVLTNLYAGVNKIKSSVADGGSAVAHEFDTVNALSTTGAKITSFKTNNVEKSYVDKDGIYHGGLNTTGVVIDMSGGGSIAGSGENNAGPFGTVQFGNASGKTYAKLLNYSLPVYMICSQRVQRVDVNLMQCVITANEIRTDMISHLANATRHITEQQSSASLPGQVYFRLGIETPAAALTDVKALIAAELTLYAAHNADAILGSDWAYHNTPGSADHVLASAAAPTTLAECIARLIDLRTKWNLHEAETNGHNSVGTVVANQTVADPLAYNTLRNDYILAVSNTDAAFTLTLSTADVEEGRVFFITDESLLSGIHNITIATEGSEKINGADTLTIAVNGGFVCVYTNGVDWFTLGKLIA